MYLAATSAKRRNTGWKWMKYTKNKKVLKNDYFARKTVHALSNASIVRSRTTSRKVTAVRRKVRPAVHVYAFRACKNYHVAETVIGWGYAHDLFVVWTNRCIDKDTEMRLHLKTLWHGYVKHAERCRKRECPRPEEMSRTHPSLTLLFAPHQPPSRLR